MRLPSAPREWTRRSLQVLAVAAAVIFLVLVIGLGLALYYLINGTEDTETVDQGAQSSSGADELDQLAASPLPTAPAELAQPGLLTTEPIGTITLPVSTRTGPAGVRTGFPHTPEGAMAQLAAIDKAAIESGTVPGAQGVITEWAAEGGPTPQTWSGVGAVAAFLESAGLPNTGDPSVVLQLEPSMGFIKGEVGADSVIPCIDFVLIASATQTNRVATADCQRMVWEGTRWVVGPGPEPATPPSLWPGTDASVMAGYRQITLESQEAAQ